MEQLYRKVKSLEQTSFHDGEQYWKFEPVTDNDFQKRIEELEDRLRETHLGLGRKVDQLKRAEKRIEELEFEEKISLGLLTDNKITIAAHKREIERLTSGLSDSNAKVEELEKENAAWKISYDTSIHEEIKRRHELTELERQLNESKAKEVRWEKECGKFKELYDHSVDERVDLQDHARALQKQLAESKAKEVRWVKVNVYPEQTNVGVCFNRIQVIFNGFEIMLPLPPEMPQPRTLDDEAQAAWLQDSKDKEFYHTVDYELAKSVFIRAFKAGREK